MTTTSTDVTVDFEGPAAMHRVLRSAGDAKLDAKAVLESGALKEILHLLVGLGLLSAAQARALWELASGGTYLPLPPIPWPDSGAVVSLYDHLRVRLAAGGATDSIFDDILGIIEDITGIAAGVEAIVHAVEAIWHVFAGD